VIERLQSILINAADGQRSVSDDRQYVTWRQELLQRLDYIPGLVATHPTVESFMAYAKGIPSKGARVEQVRKDFAPFVAALDDTGTFRAVSSSWTGIDNPVLRLKAAQELLPLARAGIEGLIATLSEGGGNNGPILDERQEAIDNLRELHRVLGEVLSAIDSGHFADRMGEGLAAEAVRYAKRATAALRDDPMPFLASGLLFGLLSAAGFPVAASILGGTAIAIRKDAKR
jgi:hypothetical protein